MVSYQEQLAKCQDTTEKYNTIWKNKEWTIKDYEDLFTDIERGYIIQGDFDTHHNYFIINPDFEEEEIEFDTDAMDNILYKDGLDWTFEKPKDGAKYSIVYIIDKEE